MIELIDAQSQEAVIKVVGVGGCGGNAVDHMISQGVQGVEFVVANTDAQALKRNQAKTQIQLGGNVTKGLGAGANPEVGRQAAIDDNKRMIDEAAAIGADCIILIGGGLFLVWKATKEIHHNVDSRHGEDLFEGHGAQLTFASAIIQILLLDLVFSLDSIITAVGMTDHVPIMVVAVVVAVTVMLVAADPLARFIHSNPTIVMLALGFLLMIGMTLIAEGFGAHVPKGYIYTAMAFSAGVELLNMLGRRARRKRTKPAGESGAEARAGQAAPASKQA